MGAESFLGDRVQLHCGDATKVLRKLAANSVDAVVCDPPYHLTSTVKRFGGDNAAPAKYGRDGAFSRASAGFMGKRWDGGDIAFRWRFWAQVARVLKPGGHLIAFGGTRTYHRLACAIEDAGFDVRDCILWHYGSGFPKSRNISKSIDARLLAGGGRTEDIRRMEMGDEYAPSGRGRVNYDNGGGSQMNGAIGGYVPISDEAKEWQGWGTALKPATEMIVLARKPLGEKTVAANVLAHGTGAINVDACRVEGEGGKARSGEDSQDRRYHDKGATNFAALPGPRGGDPLGRWPANIIHDGSDEVLAAFPDAPGAFAPVGPQYGAKASVNTYGDYGPREQTAIRGDSGSAARFFYQAKADADDRLGSKHPTVKPVDLLRYLCRLVTQPGGVVLDPFAGTGTTGEAAFYEGFRSVLIEREAEYQDDIRRRMALVLAGPEERAREAIKAKSAGKPLVYGPLFGDE